MSSLSPALQAKPGGTEFAHPPVTIILTAILLLFFFVGFFSIYCCRCFVEGMISRSQTATGNSLVPDENAPTNSGILPELVDIFPTFTYASVKQTRKEKPDLECVICLGEISDEDILRLITVCYHCFHKECIDSWLESHKTCPVCRSNLDLPRQDLEQLTDCTTLVPDHQNCTYEAGRVSATSSSISVLTYEHEVRISIYDASSGAETTGDGGSENFERVDKSREVINHGECSGQGRVALRAEAYARSHSTGHSIITSADRRSYDKYTLKLPENVMTRVKSTRRHGTTASCVAFGEFTSPVVRSADR